MIIGMVGNQRAGKTLGAVAWLRFFAALAGQPVISNTFLNFPHTTFKNWRELLKFKNGIVLFDEIDTAIDSRNFKAADQLEFTHFFKQLGKNGITLFYTTQRMHMVEKRVREQTDWTVMCHKNWLSGRLTERWYDTQAGAEQAILVRTYSLQNPQEIYKMYDSFKPIETTMKTTPLNNEKPYAPYKPKNT